MRVPERPGLCVLWSPPVSPHPRGRPRGPRARRSLAGVVMRMPGRPRQPERETDRKADDRADGRHHQPIGFQTHFSLPSSNCAAPSHAPPNANHTPTCKVPPSEPLANGDTKGAVGKRCHQPSDDASHAEIVRCGGKQLDPCVVDGVHQADRVSRLYTVLACHTPPRAVRIPRAFSAVAIARNVLALPSSRTALPPRARSASRRVQDRSVHGPNDALRRMPP